MLLIALLSAILGFASALGNSVTGINWSPFHHPYYCKENVTAVMEDDFFRMAEAGFSYVRTFYAAHYGIKVAPIAAKHGIKLALGVRMYSKDSWTDKQLVAAADQARDYPDVVTAIFLGNENVRVDGSGDFSVAEVIDRIKEMKDLLKDRGVSVPVGTVQRYPEWKSSDESMQLLADECDIIAVNLYPFYADISYDRNIEVLGNQYNKVVAAHPGKTIWVTETGFPSGGSDCKSDQDLSVARMEEYFTNVKEWVDEQGVQLFYFQYFDKKTADEQKEVCNNFLGIATAEGEHKFDF